MSLPAALKTSFAILFTLLVLVGTGQAEPVVEPSPLDHSLEQEKAISLLIRQLDADQFAQRRKATEELAKFGKQAIPAMEQAAQIGSGEVASRTIDLLKTLAVSPDAQTASSALSALQRLAAGGNKTASSMAAGAIAQLKRKLGPYRIVETEPNPPMQPAAGFQRSVRISNTNGNREIDVTENGERVVVRTSLDGSVRVTWHLPDGQEKTVQADSADQLKKQDQASFAKLQELIKIADNGPGRFPGIENRPRDRMPAPRFGNDLDPFTRAPQDAAKQAPPERPALPQQPLEEAEKPDFNAVKRRLGEMLQRMDQQGMKGITPLELKRLDDALRQIEITDRDA
ncbi:hypothetical protein DTL42_12020 [Bremerella cremea]|uniref:HEAT repeat domain-containing protein n=1 Tax=Bremerella cremea TaxID=1031537 RepID=A0A368KUF6_9BACT|nr:hypothetical protein [Bremerella cremea]RCS49257.1 hypothetical protein DTL42_12020 [Bremerella cremea]